MRQILVLSGKGGTGKTTLAAALIGIHQAKAFADCDVDAPNLHLTTGKMPEPIEHDFMGDQKAVIDQDRCSACGYCKADCRFDAVEFNDGVYTIDPIACEGCAVCTIRCPQAAITMVDDVAGVLTLYKNAQTFSTAKLKMGRGNSGKLVTEVKQQLTMNTDPNIELAFIDGSPGIGCPVIASVTGVNDVLMVVEPSLSGFSDFKRLLETVYQFRIHPMVCINKYDIAQVQADMIEDYCTDHAIDFLGKIPYDSAVSKAINEGKNLSEVDGPAHEAILAIDQKMMDCIK